MAGPQSFMPPSVSPSRTIKRFTLAQANKSLPLVRRIVADIVACHDQATQIQSMLEGQPKDHKQLEKLLEGKLERLQALVDELANVGCELKDYQMGLVDFIGQHKGRDVYLCWKLGEEQVNHWHEINSGYSGRQPVSVLEEA
jgi:hypothetical protein